MCIIYPNWASFIYHPFIYLFTCIYTSSQHDSQEFLRFLLSGLHDELNAASPSKDKPMSPSLRNTRYTILLPKYGSACTIVIFIL